MALPIVLFILGWVVSGVIAYGLSFGYFSRAYPDLAEQDYKSNMRWCLLLALAGYINLISTLIFVFFFSIHGYKGFKFK